MFLTKFGKHPIKHVEEEAVIVRKKERKKERKKKRQDPSKLGVAA